MSTVEAIEETPLLQTPPRRRRSSGTVLTMPCISLGDWQASETPGFLWDNVAAGGVLATNVFFNIAVLRLATLAAGCPAAEGTGTGRPRSAGGPGTCGGPHRASG